MLAEPQASLEGTSTSTAGPCRFCGAGLRDVFVDLGMSPLCESYLAADQLNRMEPFYPLRVFVCCQCLLVQLQEYVSPVEIFTEYAYFSSYSSAWLAHAEAYAGMIGARFGLGSASLVVEIASNDGYLLQYFVARGIPVLGVEPAAQRRRRRGGEGRADASSRSSARVARAAARRGGQGRRPDRRQQRAGARAGPQRLRRRHARPAQAAGRDHGRVPASDAPDGGEPVRHDLPRALLVFLAARRRAASSPPTASPCSTSRSSRPMAARCASTFATPPILRAR